jgi:PIN domain nuclease of toxin-antitoxin system
MRLLVDTHLVLWAAAKSGRLPKEARRLLEDPTHEVLYSAASLWEIAIKAALRRSDFRVDLAVLCPALAAMDFMELPVSGAHAEMLTKLPPIHKDPFDRMLVAQSLAENLLLLTNDASLAAYGHGVRVV